MLVVNLLLHRIGLRVALVNSELSHEARRAILADFNAPTGNTTTIRRPSRNADALRAGLESPRRLLYNGHYGAAEDLL